MKIYETYQDAAKVATKLNNCSGIIATVYPYGCGYKIKITSYE